MEVIKIKQDDGEIRKLGFYREKDKTLYIERKKSKHFFNKMKAWAIDADIFDELVEKGMKKIELHEKEKNEKLVATTENFIKFGKYLHFKPYRPQLFLNIKHWERV